MLEPTNIALIGIGGYGNVYVSALLDALPALGGQRVRLIGAADPNPASCLHLAELKALGIPLFSKPEAMLSALKPDLVVITSPIQFHHEHVMLAISHGCHVLCEKPLCATVEQARLLRDAVNRSGKHVAVGFQWSFGDAIHALKRDIQSGVLGRPRSLRTLVLWPRGQNYYDRNGWAGRVRDAQGRLVYDSPVNNACAHFLHNMLYVLGDSLSSSQLPLTVRSELYRCNPIENFDTAVVQCHMPGGAELLFAVSHATKASVGPVFEYEFENATVHYDETCTETARFVAIFNDGRRKDYGAPPSASEGSKLFATVDAIRTSKPPICGVESAIPHIAVTSAAQLSCPKVTTLTTSVIDGNSDRGVTRWVPGLDDVLRRCYETGQTPSQLGIEWAKPGTPVHLHHDLSIKTKRPQAVAPAM